MEAVGQPCRMLCLRSVTAYQVDDEGQWLENWEKKLNEIFAEDGYERNLNLFTCPYQDLFNQILADVDDVEFAESLVRIGWEDIEETVGKLFRKETGVAPLAEALLWHAGMIYHWATGPGLRQTLRQRLADRIRETKPEIVLAHSLGSILAYDVFAENPDLGRGIKLVTFGSQLGNPYVRSQFGGRLQPLHQLDNWFHLYNRHDSIFTAPLRLPAENFTQINTEFDNLDPLDHTAISTGVGTAGYLCHYASRQLVWPRLLGVSRRRVAKSLKAVRQRITESPDHRALLIGIDNYQHPSIPDLNGCVNDTFLISEQLQRLGFPRDQIRMLHNERATADRIRDRLEWLLDDVDARTEGQEAEHRLLFYSGHGAQLESYGVQEIADRQDECLCPYDFDWTISNAIIDDQIYDLYSQLPYDTHFIMVFDCCHAGGISRSTRGLRGISNPLDVANRGLYYDVGTETWRSRTELAPTKRADVALGEHRKVEYPAFMVEMDLGEVPDREQRSRWVGENHSLRRLGRAASLRRQRQEAFTDSKTRFNHLGPYLPVIFQACAEHEQALEHLHGSTTYGAFTFCLINALRQAGRRSRFIGFQALLEDVCRRLAELEYTQKPQLLAPKVKLNQAMFPC